MGVALLVAGGGGGGVLCLMGVWASRRVVLVLPCVCRAVLAVPGWPRCRGGRWLPEHPVGAVVRRQRAAVCGLCSLVCIAGGGAAGGGGALVVGSNAVGARAQTPRVYGGACWPECREPLQWGR